MEKTNSDLRKEALRAIREIEGEIKGTILLATDCSKNVGVIAGSEDVLVNILAQAMIEDPSFIDLVKTALRVATLTSIKRSIMN